VTQRLRPPARSGLARWVLVVLTLAGLGMWLPGHCADDAPALPTLSAATNADHSGAPGSPQFVSVTPATAHGPAVAQRPADGYESAQQPETTPAVAECRFHAGPAAGTGHGAPLALSLPSVTRLRIVAPRCPSITPRLSSGVSLAHLGISRT
jgi:hypothetical protein